MTVEEAKEKGFTHLVKHHSVLCYGKYLDDGGIDLEPTTNWNNFLYGFKSTVDELCGSNFCIFDVEPIEKLN